MPKLPTIKVYFDFKPATETQYTDGVAKLRVFINALHDNLKANHKGNEVSFFIENAGKKF